MKRIRKRTRRENRRRLTLPVALLLAASLLISGCAPGGGETGNGPEGGPQEAQGLNAQGWPAMNGGVPVNYMSVNGVEYEYIEDADVASHMGELQGEDGAENLDESMFNGNFIEIHGLADQEMEDEINRQIYDMYLELCQRTEVPAYRGIKQLMRRTHLCDVGVYPGRMESVGSLYSVTFQKSRAYEGDGEWHWVMDGETAVFDLKTGRRVTLGALFGDDVDYVTAVNELIRKQLPDVASEVVGSYEHNGDYIYEEGNIRQIGPFRGIDEDQAFTVGSSGIYIYFDESDAEFDTGFGGNDTILLAYDDIKDIAVYPIRFAAEDGLFQAPAGRALVADNDTRSEKEYDSGDDFIWQMTVTWPKRMTIEDRDRLIGDDQKAIEQKIGQWRERFQETVDGDSEAAAGTDGAVGGTGEMAVVNGAEVPWENLYYYTNVMKFGPYYSTEHVVYGSFGESVTECCARRIFDGDSLRELKPEELFVDGFDLKAFLMADIEEAIQQKREYTSDLDVGYTAEQAYEGRMAGLYDYGVDFVFPVDDSGTYIAVYKDFSEIGYENLILFQ